MDDRGITLSVVATSRNDDHGANLKRRMQTFVSAFIAQCQRHDLRAELILVEWNPPADRPRLAEALRWPDDPSPCEVRIVEVPEALHRRLNHAEALPLFQMIGKNVGIRRARGRFVLATNIDILLNDELIRFLKDGGAESGKIYRIDRTDVETDVPVDAPVEEQLAYCHGHHLRINTTYGTFPLSPDGKRVVSARDVSAPGSGIVLLQGASPVEYDAEGKVYRWAGGEDVRVFAEAPQDRPRRLIVELSPGPCVRRLPVEIEILLGKEVVARGRIMGRSIVSLALPLEPGESQVFQVRAVEGGYYLARPPDSRVLDFAVHRLRWSEEEPEPPARNPEEAFRLLASELDPRGDVISPAAGIRPEWGWHALQKRARTRFRWADSGANLVLERPIGSDLALGMWVGAGRNYDGDRRTTLQLRDEQGGVLAEAELRPGPHQVSLPVPGGARRVSLCVLEDDVPLAGARAVGAFRVFSCAWSDAPAGQRLAAAVRARMAPLALGIRDAVSRLARRLRPVSRLRKRGKQFEIGGKPYALPRLHTNACGDFTLMAREHWFDLGAYPELEIYSLHIDSALMYAAHCAGLEEVVLPEAMRAYHIEHSAGSGWTPEGEKRLFERLRGQGIPVMSIDELYGMGYGMAAQDNPRLFSSADWGLAGESLPETRIGRGAGTRAA